MGADNPTTAGAAQTAKESQASVKAQVWPYLYKQQPEFDLHLSSSVRHVNVIERCRHKSPRTQRPFDKVFPVRHWHAQAHEVSRESWAMSAHCMSPLY